MKLSNFFDANIISEDVEFDGLGLSNSEVDFNFLSFYEDPKFLQELLQNKKVVAVICRRENAKFFLDAKKSVVVAEKPRRTFFELHNSLSKSEEYVRKLSKTSIGEGTVISNKAIIDEYGVIIGENAYIGNFVVVHGPCVIGDNVVIEDGCKIGGSGYEFKRYEEDVLDVFHCGGVIIENNVKVWENVTIHRAVYPWDDTVIAKWARVGSGTHIDHGVKIDAFSEICARVVLSGRAHVCERSFVGPGSVVSNRVTIGNDARVLLGSVVTKQVQKEEIVSGNFAIDHSKHIEKVKNHEKME